MKNKQNWRGTTIDDELIRQTLLTYIVVIFLVILAVFFVLPKFGNLVTLRKQIKKNEVRIEAMEQSLEVLAGFDKTISETDRKMLEKVLPASYNPLAVMMSLKNLAKEVGVAIVDYSLAGGVIDEEVGADKPGVRKTKLEVKVVGPTKALMEFMEKLEKRAPLASIADVSVTAVAKMISNVENEQGIGLSLKIDYYYLPAVAIDSLAMSNYLINEKDLAVLAELAKYRQDSSGSMAIQLNGGNQNLFGE